MDSITFLEDILTVNQDMPVIFMSSKPDLLLTVTSIRFGATFVLDKPTKKYDLLNLWQFVVRKRSIAERRKERENVVMGINFNNGDKEKGKGTSVGEMHGQYSTNTLSGKPKDNVAEVKMKEGMVRIARRKRKERDEGGGFKRKGRPVWNDELFRKFMAKLKEAEDGKGTMSGAVNNPNLKENMLGNLPQQRQHSKLMHQPATSQNSMVRGIPGGSAVQFNTGSTKSPEAAGTGAPKTSNAANLAPMNLQSRIWQIRSAHYAQKHSKEANCTNRAPNLVMRQPYALGLDPAAVFRLSMAGNMTRSPGANVSGCTPALSVTLIAGDNPHPNETTEVYLNREVNMCEDEESSSENEEANDGFTLEELFLELKGDNAVGNVSTNEDDKV